MKKKYFNKLVRDKIPNILIKQNKKFGAHAAKDDEIKTVLAKKVVEEAKEFESAIANKSGSQAVEEEMADLLTICVKSCQHFGFSVDEIFAAAKNKAESNGLFNDNIVLDWVED